MKLKSYNILFRIFSFLSDRTNGAPFFVKYKLLLGTLIIGMAAPSKAQERVNKRDTLCYKQVVNKEVVLPKSNTLIEVRGKVIDEEGYTLPGVSVLIKNTISGTITDEDGNFEIYAKIDEIFIFSFTGYEEQEIPVSKIVSGKATIILTPNVEFLCYAVDVEYNDIKKEKPIIKKNRKK